MNLTFRLIYAAHCNGSHHKLAVDSLRYLKDSQTTHWRNLFLNNIEAYLQGSKAPDKTFKDFKNHVLHVRDNFWGGAADKSAEWYDRLVHNLKLKNWPEAAYSAGVLSHYYADAMHPFHTAQSEAESNIHRAAEWSISKSYDQLFSMGLKNYPSLRLDIPYDSGWVKTLVENNATFANQYYETLITHYDIHKGVVDPLEGFDDIANDAIARLIRLNTISFAVVLDRAFAEANVAPAKTGLTVKTILAGLKIPLRWVTRKMGDIKERKLVEAIYDELQETGTVRDNLPQDDHIIKQKYEEQVLSKRSYRAKQKESHTLFAATKLERRHYKRSAKKHDRGNKDMLHPHRANIAEIKTELAKALPENQKLESASVTSDTTETITLLNNKQDNSKKAKDAATRPTAQRVKRHYLAMKDPVADGPGVGDKTAIRLEKLNIFTVADFIQADPAFVAQSLNYRGLEASEILDWQNQANLMCHIPGLKALHSKLLVASGIQDPHNLAHITFEDLETLLTKISLSPEGQKIIRNKTLPSSDVMAGWIETAKGYLTSQAA